MPWEKPPLRSAPPPGHVLSGVCAHLNAWGPPTSAPEANTTVPSSPFVPLPSPSFLRSQSLHTALFYTPRSIPDPAPCIAHTPTRAEEQGRTRESKAKEANSKEEPKPTASPFINLHSHSHTPTHTHTQRTATQSPNPHPTPPFLPDAGPAIVPTLSMVRWCLPSRATNAEPDPTVPLLPSPPRPLLSVQHRRRTDPDALDPSGTNLCWNTSTNRQDPPEKDKTLCRMDQPRRAIITSISCALPITTHSPFPKESSFSRSSMVYVCTSNYTIRSRHGAEPHIGLFSYCLSMFDSTFLIINLPDLPTHLSRQTQPR